MQHARLFWAIYALDSFITVTTSQPSGLTDQLIRFFLPTRDIAWNCDQRDQDLQSPNQLDSLTSFRMHFSYLLRLVDISREIHSLYLQYLTMFDDDDDGNTRWFEAYTEHADISEKLIESLPDFMGLALTSPAQPSRRTPRPCPGVVMLHAYGHALTIYINALAQFTNRQSLSARVAVIRKDVETRCAKGVMAITEVACVAMNVIHDQIGWPFAWSMWIAARYLVTVAYHEFSVPQPQFQKLMVHIHRLGQFWQVSQKYWWLLRRAEHALNNWLSSSG